MVKGIIALLLYLAVLTASVQAFGADSVLHKLKGQWLCDVEMTIAAQNDAGTVNDEELKKIFSGRSLAFDLVKSEYTVVTAGKSKTSPFTVAEDRSNRVVLSLQGHIVEFIFSTSEKGEEILTVIPDNSSKAAIFKKNS